MSKQKTCDKGYSCGLTCISKTRSCSKKLEPKVNEFTDKVVDFIDDAGDEWADLDGLDTAIQETKAKAKAPKEKLLKKTKKGSYKDSRYEIKITNNHIEFKVDGSLDQKEGLDKRQAVGLGVAVMKSIREVLKTQPEGSIFTCSAWAMDGAGESRAKLYQAMGMGKPGGNDLMGGRIENGKLVPVSYDEIPDQHRRWAG